MKERCIGTEGLPVAESEPTHMARSGDAVGH